MESGLLYVVGTPIGNLGDITLRAIEVLGSVDAVACEDTRRTRKLLSHLGIGVPLISVPSHDEENRAPKIAERLTRGEKIAFVTDAGMPGISDPGAALVRAALEVGAGVVTVPGPCASSAAVSVSGLCPGRFCFLGFLPRKSSAKKELISIFGALPASLVIYESPNRLGTTLTDLAHQLGGERRAAVCRELTKLHEETARGTLLDLAEQYRQGTKGEVVIVVAPPDSRIGADPEVTFDQALEMARERARGGEKLKEACKAVAKESGHEARALYKELAGS